MMTHRTQITLQGGYTFLIDETFDEFFKKLSKLTDDYETWYRTTSRGAHTRFMISELVHFQDFEDVDDQ